MSKSVEKNQPEAKQEAPKQEAPKDEPQGSNEAPVLAANRKAFDEQLVAFRGSTKASMAAARKLAEMSLKQFADHGDLQYVYDFLKEIDESAKNYVRKGAYLAWLCDHAPITWDKAQKKLVKDKRPEANKLQVEKALSVAFWEYKPDKMAEFFTTVDLIQSLKALVKRHQNAERLQPANAKAAEAVTKVEKFIETLAA